MPAATAPAASPAKSSRSTLVLAAIVVAIVVALVALKLLRADSGGAAGAGGQPAPNPVSPHAPPRAPANAERAEIMQILVVYMTDDGRPMHRKDGQWVTRSKAQARQIADSILERARTSERFESLVLKYTDDVDEKGQPFNGATVSIAKGITLKNQELEAAVFSTKAGQIFPNSIDTGHAYIVFRRDL